MHVSPIIIQVQILKSSTICEDNGNYSTRGRKERMDCWEGESENYENSAQTLFKWKKKKEQSHSNLCPIVDRA